MSKTKKKQNKKSKPIVEIVEWDDHWSQGSGWQNTKLDRAPLTVYSAGVKIYEDKKVLQLSLMNEPENGHIGAVLTILKKCITKRRTI